MKDKIENLTLFISEHKAYFKENIFPNVNFSWDDDSWFVDPTHKGVFSGRSSGHLEFKKIKSIKKGIYLELDSRIDEKHEIDIEYRLFMKAFIVFLIKLNNHKISISALQRDALLLKRVYVRMLIDGNTSPRAQNITDDIISKTMIAHCSAMKNISTAADSQTAMRKICIYITRLAITLNPLTFVVTQKRPSTKATEAAKQAKIKAFHDSVFAEENDEDDSKKLITIQTFLNIVAVRGMVTLDGEKILLNMLMLLMITGFRFGELERLKTDSLKRLEIEDADASEILRSKGLKPYYLGITYIGEKGAGHRTHWVEPLAINLVETIYEDTLTLTKFIRTHIEKCRSNNFVSLIPQALNRKQEISLSEIVEHISESFSKSAKERGTASQRDYAKKSLSKFGIEPSRVVEVDGRQRNLYYSQESVDTFLSKKIEHSKDLNRKFIYRFVDSRSGNQITYNVEDILFILPEGAAALNRSSVIKPLPTPVTMSDMLKFLGSNNGSGGTSLFKKYNLIDENGEFPILTTHIPRHTINTFLAIAGITDHLQAIMMGRVDISQNKAYQHLAIEQRALASDILSVDAQLTSFKKNYECTQTASTNALDIIKESAQIYINPTLKLDNAIAQNTHTFTTKRDKVSFLVDVFETCNLDLMAGLGEAYAIAASDVEKQDLVNIHTNLHPLILGSCTRNLQAWPCPYSMMCQDGALCAYFTIIGRADDMIKLQEKLITIRKDISDALVALNARELSTEEAQELLHDLTMREENIRRLINDSTKIESTKKKVDLIGFGTYKKPKTLATIFAIEQKKMENI